MYSPASKELIAALWECRNDCQETLFGYCLTVGGLHTQGGHIKRMLDCVEICQLMADFLVRESHAIDEIAAACEELCTLCANSCEKIGDERMMRCAELCRRCAKLCRTMNAPTEAAA